MAAVSYHACCYFWSSIGYMEQRASSLRLSAQGELLPKTLVFYNPNPDPSGTQCAKIANIMSPSFTKRLHLGCFIVDDQYQS